MAELSYRLLEQPVRTGRWLRPVGVRVAGAVSAGALVVLSLAVPHLASPPVIDFDAAAERLATPPPVTAPPPAPGAGTAAPPEPPRVAVYGDSTAVLTGSGLSRWAEQVGSWQPVPGVTSPGCPLAPGGTRRLADAELDISPSCSPAVAWPDQLTATSPDVVIVQAGNWDLLPWRPPGEDEFLDPRDPRVTEVLAATISSTTDLVLAATPLVVYLTTPPPVGADPSTVERYDLWNDLLRREARHRPDRVRVVDLAGHLARQPGALEDLDLRPDKMHFSEARSLELAEDWLGPALLAAIDR